MYWLPSSSAVLAKMTPVGWLLKNGSLKLVKFGSVQMAGCAGRLPTFLKIVRACAGLVTQLMNSHAAAWFLLCAGIVRNEPPQLPPLPGMSATFHLPLVAG